MNKKNFSVFTLAFLFIATQAQASWYESFTPVLPHFPIAYSSLLTACDIARDKIVSAVQHPAAGWIVAGITAATGLYLYQKQQKKAADQLALKGNQITRIINQNKKALVKQKEQFNEAYKDLGLMYEASGASLRGEYLHLKRENANLKTMVQEKELHIKDLRDEIEDYAKERMQLEKIMNHSQSQLFESVGVKKHHLQDLEEMHRLTLSPQTNHVQNA
ncbi:hypothetical protein HYX58_06155 [Candidatus Dependentiae bacterium]|nr:hypothetical protein [Candidatus Dependentiae bacterium]